MLQMNVLTQQDVACILPGVFAGTNIDRPLTMIVIVQVETRRERLKSALYLRLKKRKVF